MAETVRMSDVIKEEGFEFLTHWRESKDSQHRASALHINEKRMDRRQNIR